MRVYLIDGDGSCYTARRLAETFNLDPTTYVCNEHTKTDTRDFPVGSRVYFHGIGWTEVVEQSGCEGCALQRTCKCGGLNCAASFRADRTRIMYVRLDRSEQAPPELSQAQIDAMVQAKKTEKESMKTADAVSHPSHYADVVPGIECIDVTKYFNFCRGNAIKYLWRAGVKDPKKEIEDLKKARQYIDFEIARIEGGQHD